MKKIAPDQKKVIPFPASAIVRPPTVIVEGPQTRCTSEEAVRLLRERFGADVWLWMRYSYWPWNKSMEFMIHVTYGERRLSVDGLSSTSWLDAARNLIKEYEDRQKQAEALQDAKRGNDRPESRAGQARLPEKSRLQAVKSKGGQSQEARPCP